MSKRVKNRKGKRGASVKYNKQYRKEMERRKQNKQNRWKQELTYINEMIKQSTPRWADVDADDFIDEMRGY